MYKVNERALRPTKHAHMCTVHGARISMSMWHVPMSMCMHISHMHICISHMCMPIRFIL